MIHLGIIGTNWISHQFVNAALETNRYDLTAVYSRKLETAQKFGKEYGDVEYATDLKTFFGIAHMDTVYIASLILFILNKRNKGFWQGKISLSKSQPSQHLKRWQKSLS